MAQLPTGTVTFLFTDIEGSTRLWDEVLEAMHRAVERHDEIVRSVIEGNGGTRGRATADADTLATKAA